MHVLKIIGELKQLYRDMRAQWKLGRVLSQLKNVEREFEKFEKFEKIERNNVHPLEVAEARRLHEELHKALRVPSHYTNQECLAEVEKLRAFKDKHEQV